jgi:nucleotide-binding universal stress UspA family protein
VYAKIAVAVHHADDEARHALALAVELARATGAELVLAGVWVSPLGPGVDVYETAVQREAYREAEIIAKGVPASVPHTILVRGATSVPRALHELVASAGVDLLVLGRSQQGRLRRMIHGDVALSVLHDAPCAVAVAAPPEATQPPVLRQVMVAYDASEEAEIALRAATDLAEAAGAALRVVWVLATPYVMDREPWTDDEGRQHWLRSRVAEAQSRLEEVRARAAERVTVAAELREGIVEPELRAAATESGADLVLVGSRSYGAVGRMLLGSTTGSLLHESPCAVLVTPRAAAARGTTPV